jgi:hypothetical protein
MKQNYGARHNIIRGFYLFYPLFEDFLFCFKGRFLRKFAQLDQNSSNLKLCLMKKSPYRTTLLERLCLPVRSVISTFHSKLTTTFGVN